MRTLVPIERPDIVDTSGMEEIMILFRTDLFRTVGHVPDEVATIVGRLVLGQAVARKQLDKWEMGAMEMKRMDDIDFTDVERMKAVGLAAEAAPATNVVPLRAVDE